jgi:SHS2 domain-containing protein
MSVVDPASGAARHWATGHTADVAIRAIAPTISALFEEAGRAVADVIADVEQPVDRTIGSWVGLDVSATDLEALAFAWLNELASMANDRAEAVLDVEVDAVHRPRDGGEWRTAGRARFAPYGPGIRARHHVKAVTYHALRARREGEAWSLRAVLDV